MILTKNHEIIPNALKTLIESCITLFFVSSTSDLLQCWAARLLIERSKAIKSPNIASHLVGCKKIQQVLSSKDVVAR